MLGIFNKVFVFIVAIICSWYLFMLNSFIYGAPFNKNSIAGMCAGNLGWIFIVLYTYIMCYYTDIMCYPFLKKWEKAILIIVAIVGTLYIVYLDLSCYAVLQYIN